MNKCFYKICIFILSIVFIVSCKSIYSDVNVLGGDLVDESDYPTVVKIFDGGKNFQCSGVIVSENVVLTAAHCVISKLEENEGKIRAYNKLVQVGNEFIPSYHVVILPEQVVVNNQEKEIFKKKLDIDAAYKDRIIINRSTYENKIEELKKDMFYPSLDLAALIFKNNDSGVSPFRSVIELAKKKGRFFYLSKKSFSQEDFFSDDKESIFFLGYGRNNTYQNRGDIKEGSKNAGKLQIGYNSIMYYQDLNEWSTPLPEKSSKKFSSFMFKGANADVGDSGGPLIYKNQILGVSSRTFEYDCNGNNFAFDALSDEFFGIDPKTGKKKTGKELEGDSCVDTSWYVSTSFASITLGSDQKIAEFFIEEVNNNLYKYRLLNNGANSIFSELLEK